MRGDPLAAFSITPIRHLQLKLLRAPFPARGKAKMSATDQKASPSVEKLSPKVTDEGSYRPPAASEASLLSLITACGGASPKGSQTLARGRPKGFSLRGEAVTEGD